MRANLREALDRVLFGPNRSEPEPEIETFEAEDSAKWSTENNKTATSPGNNGARSSAQSELHEVSQKLSWPTYEATWDPSPFQVRPLVGLAALCVAIACVFASLAILIIANGSLVSHWPIQPNVYLAVVTAIANGSIALAKMEATPISWWYSASHGRTIRSLERQWQVSRSFVQAVRYCKYLSLLNIACIAATLVIFDGPLLQRAAFVATSEQPVDVPLQLTLPPELPRGFCGTMKDGSGASTEAANQLFDDYEHQRPIITDVQGCPDKCEATILGPGVVVDGCNTQVWPITKEMMYSVNASWGLWKARFDQEHGPYFMLPMFSIVLFWTEQDFQYEVGEGIIRSGSGVSKVQIGTANYSGLEERGQYTLSSCNLMPAILEYDVVMEQNTMRLPQRMDQGRFVQFANSSQLARLAPEGTILDPKKDYPTTFATIIYDIGSIFDTNASFGGERHWTDIGHIERGHIPTWLPQNYGMSEQAQAHVIFNHQFFVKFSDPMPDIIFAHNEFMLRGAAKAASWSNITHLIDSGVSIHQVVDGKALGVLVYRTELSWFAGAAVLELIAILMVLPMFWGWWTLGRNVTLSPFNIALAFDSPILNDINSAAGARGVVDELGRMQLRFGAVGVERQDAIETSGHEENNDTPYRLGMAQSQDVIRPRKGMVFQ